jgi:hypothetical protein
MNKTAKIACPLRGLARQLLVLCRSSVPEFGSGRILQIRPKFGSAEFREQNPTIFLDSSSGSRLWRRYKEIIVKKTFRSIFLGPLVIISHVLTISCSPNTVYTSCSFVYRILPVIRRCKQMVCLLSFNKSGSVRPVPVLATPAHH